MVAWQPSTKTTIQHQMIEALLQSGVPPQRIAFISMDHPMLKLNAMNKLLECYHEKIRTENRASVILALFKPGASRFTPYLYQNQPHGALTNTLQDTDILESMSWSEKFSGKK